jgi:hypothetical protein
MWPRLGETGCFLGLFLPLLCAHTHPCVHASISFTLLCSPPCAHTPPPPSPLCARTSPSPLSAHTSFHLTLVCAPMASPRLFLSLTYRSESLALATKPSKQSNKRPTFAVDVDCLFRLEGLPPAELIAALKAELERLLEGQGKTVEELLKVWICVGACCGGVLYFCTILSYLLDRFLRTLHAFCTLYLLCVALFCAALPLPPNVVKAKPAECSRLTRRWLISKTWPARRPRSANVC